MAARIRAVHPTARVLFMSGYADISAITGGDLTPRSSGHLEPRGIGALQFEAEPWP